MRTLRAESIEAGNGELVTFTRAQKQHGYHVVDHLMNDVGADELGPRLFALRSAVADDLSRPAS